MLFICFVVDILGSIDEKIENLELQNVKLQNIGLAQFKVVFRDKERTPLKSIATVTMGQSPAGSTITNNKGVVFYQGRTDFGFRYPTVRLFTTEPNRMAKKGDILLSVRAPAGDVNRAFEDCCIGRGIAAISSEYCSFIYYSLLFQKNDFDIYNNSGTIFGSINRDSLMSFVLPAVDIDAVKAFNAFAASIDEKIFQNTNVIKKLQKLKSLYLQKFFG